MTESDFNLNEAFAMWYTDLTGETICQEEDAFYDLVDYVDLLISRLMRFEKKTERIKELLDDDEDEEGFYGECLVNPLIDGLNCEADE